MAVDDQITAIIGARVIDGLGRDPIEKGTVVIEGNRISAVGKDTAVQIPHGANVLDAAGRTVLPGIIDCHVHSTLSGPRHPPTSDQHAYLQRAALDPHS